MNVAQLFRQIKLQVEGNMRANEDLAPVVQKVDSAIHRINHYPVDNTVNFANAYPLNSDSLRSELNKFVVPRVLSRSNSSEKRNSSFKR